MIKDNNHIELEILKKTFLQEIGIDYDKLRILNWNFILRNLTQLKSESFIYLFIDNGRNILNSDTKKTLKNIVKDICNKYSTVPEKIYKIKFLSEHNKPLTWYSNFITTENFKGRFGISKTLEKEIKNLSNYLKYYFDIYNLTAKFNEYGQATEIIFFIDENFISSEL